MIGTGDFGPSIPFDCGIHIALKLHTNRSITISEFIKYNLYSFDPHVIIYKNSLAINQMKPATVFLHAVTKAEQFVDLTYIIHPYQYEFTNKM